MCGIYGVVNDGSQSAAAHVLEGLKKLEYRGYDSWGISLIPQGKQTIQVEKHVGKIGEAKTVLPRGSTALGHTRWATHGGVTKRNAHPHLDCTKRLSVIHNGIVENYQELKEYLVKKGHRFLSETDTEVIAHLIEEEVENASFSESVRRVFTKLTGSNAVAALDSCTSTIVACRNGSPLVVGVGKESFYLASDVTPFLHMTRRVHFVKDGEGVELTPSGVKLFDVKSAKKKKLVTEIIDWRVEDAEKGGYPHFLLKEIEEQRLTIPHTAKINTEVIRAVADLIRKESEVVLIGCGTAAYCALAARYFFAKEGIRAEAYGAYEYIPFASFAGKKTLFIAISQSGETADTLIAVKQAKERGSVIVALVNARGSTLERMAHHVIPVAAGPEIAVVSTKAFTSQLATLYLLSQAINNKYKQAKKNVTSVGYELTRWFSSSMRDKVVKLARDLVDKEHAYVIGKNLQYPAALEVALKLKESAYLHAEAFAAGELKHGVIALIRKGTPCFVLCAEDDVKKEVLSSAAELRARGGYIIGIAPHNAPEFDYHFPIPSLGDLTLLGAVIAGQRLGYYLGIGRGADPDKPRNLAKSVTVK